ncbi:antimicrobial peptide NK-lysin-like [Talpa occidentalis]|uniref:antimicrobial peptide NK-lysin-like n=1 Tax=Talpa occidentalis TaxID=50954 RepID=UPI00188F9C08|nr:antimicrobial peptide NK-lysin-like [Talpa occidentalis]
MTTWALLLLVSVLLDTPGLSSSEHYDQARSDPCDGDPFCQNLMQEDLQDELLTKSEGLRITCGLCKRIIHTLKSLVGSQLNEYTIAQAATHVCGKMGLLRIPCSYIMKSSLRIISEDLIEGKDARDICVDLKMCRSRAGPM